MSLPLNEATEFEVAQVEKKKVLPAEGTRPARVILKLGLKHGDAKGWAEMFAKADESDWPQVGSKVTLTLSPGSKPEYPPTAKRPSRGGFGGGRRRDPAETKAIQRQHSQEMALRALCLLAECGGLDSAAKDDLRAELVDWADWFDRDISRGKAGHG